MARILLVNDEADLVEITKMVLEDAGHRVTALTEGRKAVETAFRICPDILILDWNLDGITAEEVLRQLRLDSRTARLPILLNLRQGRERDTGADVSASTASCGSRSTGTRSCILSVRCWRAPSPSSRTICTPETLRDLGARE